MKIGIIGLIGSGKDTFGSFLVQELNKLITGDLSENTFVIDKYAAPLKALTARIYRCTLDDLEDHVFKEKPQQYCRDSAIDEVFKCLKFTLKFTNEEMDLASELYFETFQSARAVSPREFQQLFGTEIVRKVRKTAWVDRLQARKDNLVVTDIRFENELCDYNVLIRRFENIDRPKHPSEHLAWDLQFTGKLAVLNTPLFDINNRHPITLGELQKHAQVVAKNILLGV